MSVRDQRVPTRRAASYGSRRRPPASPKRGLLGGGPDGNEVLTTATGVLLIVLLAALGVTIVLIGRLLFEHLFLSFLLLGPVLLKLASTGYRFTRYYTGHPEYVKKGPPWMPLRMLAPLVVALTFAVFFTGIMLVVVGPLHRDPWVLLHKATFILWIGVTALHVLGHVPEVSRLLGIRDEVLQLPGVRTDLNRERFAELHAGQGTSHTGAGEARGAGGSGSVGRAILIGGSLIFGLVIALLLIPDFHTWTTLQPLLHGGGH